MSTYELVINGRVGEQTLAAFEGCRARYEGRSTIVTGWFPTPAALTRVLRTLEALGLGLTALRLVEDDP